MTTTAVSNLSALLERIRRVLKGKERTPSTKILEMISTLEEHLAARPAEREALERGWSDSILDATPADQKAHRAALEEFDLDTEKAAAALSALRPRLDAAIVDEANDEATRRISRQLDRALSASELIPRAEQQMRELRATLLDIVRLQGEWRRELQWLNEHARDRIEPELMAHVGDLLPRRFFLHDALLGREDYSLESIVDGRQIWPPRDEDLHAPEPEE